MSDVFTIRRFGWYAQREFRENWKAYALGLVGMMAVLSYFLYIGKSEIPFKELDVEVSIDIFPSLVITMALLVWISSGFSLKGFSQTNERLRTLLLPVSNLERVLYAWLMSVPIPMLVCLVVWKVSWLLAIEQWQQEVPHLKINTDFSYGADASYFSIFILTGSAVFMLGAMTLGKLNFLKTIGILLLSGLVILNWGQGHLLRALFPAEGLRYPTPAPWVAPTITVRSEAGITVEQIHSLYENIYQGWWVLCLPICLYVIVFLKMKEREV
jgi:hypothetical protein